MAATLFAVGWLGFAVTPCQAMNAVPDQASHHGSMPAGDCGHCPPAPDSTPDCPDLRPMDCFSAAQPLTALREAQLPQPFAALPPAAFDSAVLAPAPRGSPPTAVNAVPLAHASLQQRYCSYLK